MFPNGVIYEGVSKEPFKMRGESGANDSMVPLGDNLLEITANMPVNPLTNVLKDFRTYRPRNHQTFLEYVQRRATAVGLRDFAMKNANSAALYLANLDQIRAFRHRREYLTPSPIPDPTSSMWDAPCTPPPISHPVPRILPRLHLGLPRPLPHSRLHHHNSMFSVYNSFQTSSFLSPMRKMCRSTADGLHRLEFH